MPTSDTSEKGLEKLICMALTGLPCDPAKSGSGVAEPVVPYGGEGYMPGDPADYDRDHAIDLKKLTSFIKTTQPKLIEALDLESDSPKRQQSLARLQGEIAKRGVIDVLRNGAKHGPHTIDLFYGTPTVGLLRNALIF